MPLATDQTRDALRALHGARRKRRMGELDWVEILYKAYITAVVSLATLFTLAAIVGDTPVTQATLERIRDDGPAWIGLVVAVGVALGLRSGARGGPLALEAPDVEHVLLAPVDRGLVLRGSAWRQARGVALVGLIGGALAGLLMAQRVPGYASTDVASWMVAGTATGGLAAFAVWGAALIGSGRRVSTVMAAVVGTVLVGWSVIDIAAETITSPASMLGALAIWPLEVRLIAIVGAIAAIAVPVIGLLGIGSSSVEAAQRRSGLVGALRFAATIQDLRAVIVLHRQLSQERSRERPWFAHRARSPVGRPYWRRDWQGVLRWPLARVGRVVALGALAGLAAYGSWQGTTPLIVLAGIALYIAGLDAIEPLAQEVDHPDRGQGVPIHRGSLYSGHLLTSALVMVLAACVGLAVAEMVNPSRGVLAVGAITVLPVGIAVASAAALSVVLGAPNLAGGLQMTFPEAATIGLILRQAFPPLLCAIAVAPVLAAREAVHQHGDPIGIAVLATLPALLISAAVVAYLRSRRSVVF